MIKVIKNTGIILLFLFTLAILSCAKVGSPPGKITKTEGEVKINIVSAEVIDNSHIVITFSSPLSPETALEKTNYNITSQDGTSLEILDLIDNRKDVITLITSPQKNTRYSLTIANLKDEKGLLSKQLVKTNFKGNISDDRTPPALIKTAPSKNSKDVSPSQVITLLFNDIIDKKSLENSIEIIDDLGEKVSFNIQGKGTIWYLLPREPLLFLTEYKVTLSDNIKDISGNKIYYADTVSFSTIVDNNYGSISGSVLTSEKIGTDSITLVLSTESLPELALHSLISILHPQNNGSFSFNYLPPTKEDVQYYIHCFVDENNDGIYEMFARSDSLPLTAKKERSGVELRPKPVDREGPEITLITVYPEPYISGDIMVEVSASDIESGGALVDQIEVFINGVLSNGSGVNLPVDKSSSQMTRGSVILAENELTWHSGKITVYVHAHDSNGNWGKFTSVEIVKNKGRLKEIKGEVILEASPVSGAVVIAYDNNETPVSIGRCNSKGKFGIKVPGDIAIGEIAAFSDDNKNGHLDGGEPFRKVKFTEGMPVQIVLSHPPDITYANALLKTSISDKGMKVFILTITAVASDDDYDLKSVFAELPWGDKIELKDDGEPPDKQAKDGIFTSRVSLNEENIAFITKGETRASARVIATDSIGNETVKTESDYEGLEIRVIEPVSKVNALDDGKLVNIDWISPSQEYSYVIFIVPSDDVANFTGPDSTEIWSNISSPVKKPPLIIKREVIKKYWGYPSGYKFVIYVYAYKHDNLKFEEGDVGINTGILVHR